MAIPLPGPLASAQGYDCLPEQGLVVLATGTAGYWPDVHTYQREIQACGMPACILRPRDRQPMTRRILADYRRGKLVGPIVLIGYSQGAAECIRMARDLSAWGIRIRALLLLECGRSLVVPHNVTYCFNLFTSNPATDWMPLLRGLPVCRESLGTKLVNCDARRTTCGGSAIRRQRHLALGSSGPARRILVAQARSAYFSN